MDSKLLRVYLPMDRRQALARGQPLPDRAQGAALMADVAGFTQLTNELVETLGPRRGAEELIRQLNAVHDALISQVHRHDGSVIGFSGDGFVCWFDHPSTSSPRPGSGQAGQASLRAVACGLALHRVLRSIAAVPTPGGDQISFSLKVAIVAGPVRRLVVGDPQIQRLDLLAGASLERLALAERQAAQGEIVVGPETVQQLGERLIVTGWRAGFGIVGGLAMEITPAPWPDLDAAVPPIEAIRPFLLPPVYERLVAGQGEFLAELRPAVALFQRFGGLDYGDDQTSAKLDAYIRWVQGILDRYGGYLLQLTSGEKGNYLYASFGALAVHEDDAERAVAAALALQRLPPNLAYITDVQVGLSQGRVRAGAYGSRTRRTYGAQGDEVNVAARLMQAAPPGEIRCSQHIYQAAKGTWRFEALPAVEVKGKTEALPIYQPAGRQRDQSSNFPGPLALRRQIGDRRGEAWCRHNQGRLALAQGDLSTARESLEAAYSIFTEIEHPDGLDTCTRTLARVEQAETTARQAGRISVCLPRDDAPLGRPLGDDETVAVTWTVDLPQDATIPHRVDCRRHRLLRLLTEAQSQGAVPAYRHLAKALGVSQRTIERDMAILRQEHPDLPPTRGKVSE